MSNCTHHVCIEYVQLAGHSELCAGFTVCKKNFYTCRYRTCNTCRYWCTAGHTESNTTSRVWLSKILIFSFDFLAHFINHMDMTSVDNTHIQFLLLKWCPSSASSCHVTCQSAHDNLLLFHAVTVEVTTGEMSHLTEMSNIHKLASFTYFN